MRLCFFGGCAAMVALAAACTDMPSAPDRYDPVPLPSFATIWDAPADCFSATQTALRLDSDLLTTQEETDAAEAADLNGNGWVCLNLDEVSLGVYETPPPGERTDFDDDHADCPSGYTAEFRGENAGAVDENGNGFVCVSNTDATDVVDDTTDSAGQLPGDDPPPLPPCGAGEELIEVTTEEHEAVDQNGNGLICSAFFGLVLSDDFGGAPPPPPPPPETLTLTEGKINGHGVYDVAGATHSFSFHAKSDGESVKGNFEFHNRTSGARIHGDVTCVEVDGGTALMEGIITNDKEGGPGDGVALAWTAVDNGEGKNDPDDQVSILQAFGDWTEACGVRPTADPRPISGGNIQVR